MGDLCIFQHLKRKAGNKIVGIVEIGAIAGATLSIIALIKVVWKAVIVINNLNSTVIALKKDMLDLTNEITKMKKEDKTQSNSIRSILRQLIIDYTNIILDRKYIYKEEVYCLRQLHESYTLLGGNSTVEERVKEAMKLPAKAGQFNPPTEIVNNIKKEFN